MSNVKSPSKVFLHWTKLLKNNNYPYLVKLKLHILYDPTFPLLCIDTLNKCLHTYTKIHNQECS